MRLLVTDVVIAAEYAPTAERLDNDDEPERALGITK